MTLSIQDAERLVREAAVALQQGRTAAARGALEQVTASGLANVQVWLMLAMACDQPGDDAAREAAVDAVLASDPHVVRALIMKGDCRRQADALPAAVRHYKLALAAAADQPAISSLASELQRAEQAITDLGARHLAIINERLDRNGLARGPRSARFQQSLDIMAGRKEIYFQEPTAYFFPGLPHVQFFDTDDFAWATAVEAETDAIRAELQAVLAAGRDGFRPYMHSHVHSDRNVNAALIDSFDWSALFLVENGREDAAMIARCPRTWAALQAAPLPRIEGASPTVMFSLLKPGAHIAAHTGMLNTRLTCHLPLIVPPGCRFRVGNEVREWEEGRLMVFDDTIEHEAWNDGAEERVVLIFDIWRPELTEQERREVTAFSAVPLSLQLPPVPA